MRVRCFPTIVLVSTAKSVTISPQLVTLLSPKMASYKLALSVGEISHLLPMVRFLANDMLTNDNAVTMDAWQLMLALTWQRKVLIAKKPNCT